MRTLKVALCAFALLPAPIIHGEEASLGIFESHADIGDPHLTGSAAYDGSDQIYTVSGGGENMWFAKDSYHFLWKKISGDVALSAEMSFVEEGGNPHRKACLILRQSVDADSAYADAALHGDGLTSLQYRESQGARTYEIQSSAKAPKRLRIEKRGKYVSMSIAETNGELHSAGGSFRLIFEEPFYVGLGVCAHDDRVLEKVRFSKVELTTGASVGTGTHLLSTLESVTIASKDRRAIYTSNDLIEAPNWSRDGEWVFFNSKGRIHRIAAGGGEPVTIETAFATRCNNDHGISPDGTRLVISDQSQERRSIIYTLPITGGLPQRITKLGPSYWHGWSPDGQTLAYCAERDGEFDIYTTAADGLGEEKRLTKAKGLDDGPDYSSDGKFIYFNSDRGGTMQIWRMRADGSEQKEVTSDQFNNWFPHPSPDGNWIVFLSYEKDVKGHPENQDVTLRLMPSSGGPIEVLAKVFGGQGTINVPSWSPDARKVAFVSYQFVP